MTGTRSALQIIRDPLVYVADANLLIVAESLAAYRDAGCRLFNLMPVAADDATGVAGIAEIKRLLS